LASRFRCQLLFVVDAASVDKRLTALPFVGDAASIGRIVFIGALLGASITESHRAGSIDAGSVDND
jgi:hypothetical protein